MDIPKRNKRGFFKHLALILLPCLLLTAACKPINTFTTADGMVWNTTYHIVYEGGEELKDSILSVLKEVENSVSVFADNSLVSKVNRNKDQRVDRHFINVYHTSLNINQLTEGRFDPTLSPLIEAWGFGKGHQPTADTLRIDSIMEFVGIEKTRLEKDTLFKEDERISFNFSALAKGYGVDCVADMLERNGVRNFLIEIGGEIRCLGHNPKNEDWTISIDSPMEGNNAPGHFSVSEIRLTEGGVATSGNYRNFHETSDGKYGHTISPADGRPVKTDVLSATVIAPSAMLADALATSCMAIGSEAGMKLCDQLDCGVMLVLDNMSVVTNNNFKILTSQTSEPGTEDQN